VKLQFLSPAIMDVSFTLGEIEERDLQPGRDNILVCTVHVLGFVYGKQEKMPACVVVPSSSARQVTI